ncbi:hypothetical protein ACSBR2_037940 [Camellia fascicularis]
MQVYWSSIFILPKKITDIESLFRSFFLTGSDLRKHGAKIAWDRMCATKNEGGLGFKSVEVWNKAAVAKHIWFLFSGGEQLIWYQWVKSYILKGKSVWKVKAPSDPSWVWRKILALGPIIYSVIKHVIGDGLNTFMWYDNWHPFGSLRDKFGKRIMYETNLNSESKVKKIVCDQPGHGTDKGPCNIPTTSFVTWMAVQGRLTTGDRIVLFGIDQPSIAVSWPNLPWPDLVTFLSQQIKGKSLKAIISRLGFTCTVYHLCSVFAGMKIKHNPCGLRDVQEAMKVYVTAMLCGLSDGSLYIVCLSFLAECCELLNRGLNDVSIYVICVGDCDLEKLRMVIQPCLIEVFLSNILYRTRFINIKWKEAANTDGC